MFISNSDRSKFIRPFVTAHQRPVMDENGRCLPFWLCPLYKYVSQLEKFLLEKEKERETKNNQTKT